MKTVQRIIDVFAVSEAIQMFAREAGRRVRDIRDKRGASSSKDGNLLAVGNNMTVADALRAYFLENFFSRRFPGCVVTEEEKSDKVRTDAITEDSLVFIVAPIVGGTVSVGAFRNWKPLAGCIYVPAINDMYYTVGDQSFFNGRRIRAFVPKTSMKTAILLKQMRNHHSVRRFPGKILCYGRFALHSALALTATGLVCACVTGKHKVNNVAGAAKLLANAGAELRYLNGALPDWQALIRNPTERAPDYFFACPKGSFEGLSKYVTLDDREAK